MAWRWPRRLTPSWTLRFFCGAFLFGILVASFAYPFPSGQPDIILSSLGAILLMFLVSVGMRRARKDHVIGAILLSLFGFSCAVVAYGFAAWHDGSLYSGEHRLDGDVVQVERGVEHQKVYVRVPKTSNIILVFTPLFPEIRYGDHVLFSCDVQDVQPIEGFRYDRYLATKDVYSSCFLYESPIIESRGGGSRLLRFTSQLHDSIGRHVYQTFGDPHAALLAGLLLGDQHFRDVWEERFQATGTTHIVAASGYNVTVVLYVLFGVLVYFGVKRPHAYGFLFTGVVGYVLLAGADAPIVRAGIMGALVLTSKQFGRRTTMTNILLLTGVGMLIVEPRLLRDDVGFQLSALSTVGLVYASGVVEKRFSFVPKTFALRESIAATVTATVFTLPIILTNFGQISLLSPIANVLILPVVPYAMAFGALATIVSFVSTGAALIVSGPAWALLGYVLWVIEALASLPISHFSL